MQKFFSLLIVLLVFAQANSQNFNLGVKAGLNYSDVLGDRVDGIEARPSFEAGFFAEIPLRGKFSFHPELLYSSRRANTHFLEFPLNPQGIEGEGDLKSNSHNIIVPLITKYNFNDNFSLEIGPQIGFLVRTSVKFDEFTNSFSDDVKFDIGPTLGLGYDVGDKLKLQLRYFIGVSDILRQSDFEKVSDEKDNQFNSVLSFTAGFVIF